MRAKNVVELLKILHSNSAILSAIFDSNGRQMNINSAIGMSNNKYYQAQYASIVGERGSFFLPCPVEELFERFKGLPELFEQQKYKYAALEGIDESMQILIDEIRVQKKGIEQEILISLNNQKKLTSFI